MPGAKNGGPEYQTAVVGAAPLVKGILDRLGVAQTIDRFLKYQPEVPTTYGALAQIIIVNRMSFQPQPLNQLGPGVECDRFKGVPPLGIEKAQARFI